MPASLDLCRYQGQLYGLPFLIDDAALLWDKQRLPRGRVWIRTAHHATLEDWRMYAVKLDQARRGRQMTRLGLRPSDHRQICIYIYGDLCGG